MTYKQATKEVKRVGTSKAEGEALIAMTCDVVSMIHPGISAEMLYNGAIKTGTTAKDLMTMAHDNPKAISDLMFV